MKDLPLIKYVSNTESFIIEYNPNEPAQTGRDVLISKIIKLLLTKKESNIFDFEFGNPFYNELLLDTPGKKELLESSVPIYLEVLTEKIKTEQNSIKDLPPEEKLRNLELVGVSYEEAFNAWLVLINIVTEDNQTTIIRV